MLDAKPNRLQIRISVVRTRIDTKASLRMTEIEALIRVRRNKVLSRNVTNNNNIMLSNHRAITKHLSIFCMKREDSFTQASKADHCYSSNIT